MKNKAAASKAPKNSKLEINKTSKGIILKRGNQEATVKEKDIDDFINSINFCSFVLYDFLENQIITPAQNDICQKILKKKMASATKLIHNKK